MRWLTVVPLVCCAAGLSFPVVFAWDGVPVALGANPRESLPGLLRCAAVAVLSAAPYAVVAGSAWAVRCDGWRSAVVAGVALVVAGLGFAGWAWSAGASRESERAAAQVVVAGVQLLVWLSGAVVAAGRGSRAEPRGGPSGGDA